MKGKKKSRVVASIVAAREGKSLPQKAEVSACQCSKCKQTFAVNASMEAPHCPVCGGEVNRVAAKVQDLSTVSENELVAVNCPSCTTSMIMGEATLAMLDGHMNCVVCGTGLGYAVDESQEEAASEDDALSDETTDEDEAADEAAGGDEDGEPEGDAADDGEDTDLDLGGEDETASDDEDQDDLGLQVGDDDADAAGEEDSADEDLLGGDEIAEGADSDESEDTDAGESTDEGDDEDEEAGSGCDKKMTLSLFRLVATNKDAKPRLERSGTRIVAYLDDIPVGYLEANAETAGVFDSKKFMSSITASFGTHGARETLKAYGFKGFRVKVDASILAEDEIGRRVAGEKAALEKAFKGNLDIFKQSLQIAAAGLNKNFFGDHEHALKRSLYDALAGLNIKNASKVIDHAFASVSDEYNDTLITIAFDLMSKPDEVRNELAATVAGTRYLPAAEVADADEDMDDSEDTEVDAEDQLDDDMMGDEDESANTVEARLSRPMTRSRQSAVASMAKKFPRGTLFVKSF